MVTDLLTDSFKSYLVKKLPIRLYQSFYYTVYRIPINEIYITLRPWKCFGFLMIISTELLPLESAFKTFWSPQKFVHSSDVDDGGEDWKPSIEALGCLKNDEFWVQVRVVRRLGFLGEFVGRWAEGCPCHQSDLLSGRHIDCGMKQCRAPELATGDALGQLKEKISDFNSDLPSVAATGQLSATEQSQLTLLVGKVASNLYSELQMKFAYWQQLPHSLCGLGHHDQAKACLAATKCLQAYDGTSPGSLQMMSRRFLDPAFDAPGESGLCEFVQRMSKGESVYDIGNAEFTHWVTALASIKVVERPVEGLHSRISKITKTAPNQSMSLISMELRFGSLLELMKNHPELLDQCHDAVIGLERAATFKEVVKKHLGLNIDLDSERDMANLLYRENIRMKHSKKHTTKHQLAQHKAVFGTGASSHKPVTVDGAALVLGSHLGAISCQHENLFFAVPTALFAKCAVPLQDVAAGCQVVGEVAKESSHIVDDTLTLGSAPQHAGMHVCRAVRANNMSRLNLEGALHLRDADFIIEELVSNHPVKPGRVVELDGTDFALTQCSPPRLFAFAWFLGFLSVSRGQRT